MYDFSGIGNACLDVIASVDEQFLERYSLRKSYQGCIDKETKLSILSELDSVEYQLGGAASNVSSVIAALGGKAAFMGRLSNDLTGQKVLAGLAKEGVHYPLPPIHDTTLDTAEIFSLTTPDAERTFASYYGISNDISIHDIDLDIIKTSKVVYLDGYSLFSPDAYDAFMNIVDQMSDEQILIFQCGDVNVVEEFRDQVLTLVEMSSIAIFNEQEAQAVFPNKTAEDIATTLSKKKTAGAVTQGSNGAYIFQNGIVQKIPCVPLSGEPIDTCGAGDHFTAGFLYGILQGYTLDQSGKLAALCASDAIQHFGARPQGSLKHFLEAT